MKKDTQIARKVERKPKKNVGKKDDVELTIKFNKKKVLQGIGIVLVVVAVLGLAFAVSKKSDGKSTAFEFVNIDIDQYLEKMEASEKSIIYVARPGCSWCQKESPIIKKIGGQYNLTINYLNTDPFWDSSANDYTEAGYKFLNSGEPYKSEQRFGTPNTIIVGNGEIIDGEFSYVDAATLKDLFVRNGFINE